MVRRGLRALMAISVSVKFNPACATLSVIVLIVNLQYLCFLTLRTMHMSDNDIVQLRYRPICIKVKVHTLDIAPLRSESPPHKRSGMARVLKGFHSRSWYSFTDTGGMEG